MKKITKNFFFLLLFFAASVVPALAVANWVGNSAIQVNDKWYYAGQNALSWCSGGEFNGNDLGTVSILRVAGQSEIWEQGNNEWGIDSEMMMYYKIDDNEPVTIYLNWAGFENNNNIFKTGGQFFSHLNIDISNLTIGEHTLAVKFGQDGLFDPASGYSVATFTKVLGGSGTENNPYLINSTVELDYIADKVSNGSSFSNIYFKLNADLDYTGKTYIPIGTEDNPFEGTFDGNGKSISGISLNGGDYLGAFGYIFGEDCLIQNLKVSGSITGGEFVGGIVGNSYNGNIIGCSNAATIVGNSSVGGIVGCITNSDISDCLSTGDVQGNSSSSNIGGIVGYCDNGSINAGLCSAAVSGTNFVGGIVGSFNESGSFMQACIYIGNSVSGESRIGALIGEIIESSTPDENHLSKNYYTNVDIGGVEGSDITENDGAVRGYILGTSMVTSDVIGQEIELSYPVNGIVCYENGLKYGEESFILNYVPLYNAGGNDAALSQFNEKMATVKLIDRTLFTDNDWNTLCLPFGVEDGDEEDGISFTGTLLEGATVMTLASSDFSEGTLSLEFEIAESISAGVPYIVKWEDDNNELPDIVNPKFNNVLIMNVPDLDNTKAPTPFVDFIGCFEPVSFEDANPNILYLGAQNTLYYPSGEMTINTFRAYFKLNLEGGSSAIKAFNLSFGDEEMGIKEICTSSNSSNTWYTLDGRRLNEKPTTSGIYIHNGRKVVFK